MSEVISLLEQIATDADLSRLTSSTFQRMLDQQQLDPELKAALLAKDVKRVEKILNARANIVCAIFPAEEEPRKKEDDDKKEDDKKEQSVIESQRQKRAIG